MTDDVDGTPTPPPMPPPSPPAPPAPVSPWKRGVRVPFWSLIVIAVLFVGAVGVASQTGPTDSDVSAVEDELHDISNALRDANDRIDSLEGELSATQIAVVAARDEAEVAEAERDAAEDARAAAERERNDAVIAAERAETDLQEILTRFDPQIQAALAQVQAQADGAVCSAGDAAGFFGQPIPTLDAALEPLLSTIPDGAFPGTGPSDLLNMPTLAARLQQCYDSAALRGRLEGPHGNGFFTVGLEIGAGRWRSTGTADDCYWAITPDGNPDDILSNHFGNAGGTVTLQNGQEFETDGCGEWVKV